MKEPEKYLLENCDPEDISDALVAVQRSFGIEYAPDALLPRRGRRRKIRELQWVLGAELGLLDLKFGVGMALLIGYLLSFLGIFINWRYGVGGIAVCTMANWAAWRLANELTCETVGEVARLFVQKHYRRARRDPETVNRREIVPVIKEIFQSTLDLSQDVMTPEARVF